MNREIYEVAGNLRTLSSRTTGRCPHSHLEACCDCAISLANYRKTIQMGQAAFTDPEGEIPEHVSEELVQAILHARRMRIDQ